MAEQWRPVVGFEGYYEVSDQGSVRSVDRTVERRGAHVRLTGRRMSPSNAHPSGHLYVHLHQNGHGATYQVHRLVMAAFVSPCPEGMEVRHLNGDPTDNRVENLAYGTRAENIRDQVTHGVHNKASLSHCKRGHEFTPENTYINGEKRVCVTCRREYKRQWRARRRSLALPVH
ncbi:NUMOD4 motif-containing HNH endonuclease [Dietzia cinnamea]|uniref:NUMOD4 motif-containing HNH endonuclease n=1 Tax=Dietzia cinnamea TaxID=321318 RepID=UPI0035CD0625